MEPMTNMTEPTPSASVDDGAAEFSIFDFLTVLARRKWFIVAAAFVTGIIGVCLSFLIAPKFTATVTLLPPQQTSGAGSAALAQLGNLASLGVGGLGGKNPVDMYVALMRSETVEDTLINRFSLAQEYRTKRKSDTRKTLESSVYIEAI